MSLDCREEAVLRDLTVRAEREAWSVEQDLPWAFCAPPTDSVHRQKLGVIAAAFVEGERVVAALCRQLRAALDQSESRISSGPQLAFLATQIADEERHAAAYLRYLEWLDLKGPEGDSSSAAAAQVRALVPEICQAPDPAHLLALCHIVMEGEAVHVHGDLRDHCPCPLLQRLNRLVRVDEARHIAFGKIQLRRQIASLSLRQREEVHGWVAERWRLLAGVPFLSALPVVARWHRHARILQDLGVPPQRGELGEAPGTG
jgi:hypothetical protein